MGAKTTSSFINYKKKRRIQLTRFCIEVRPMSSIGILNHFHKHLTYIGLIQSWLMFKLHSTYFLSNSYLLSLLSCLRSKHKRPLSLSNYLYFHNLSVYFFHVAFFGTKRLPPPPPSPIL